MGCFTEYEETLTMRPQRCARMADMAAAACAHGRQHGTGGADSRHEGELECPLPIGLGEPCRRPRRRTARVVHQHMDGAITCQHGIDHATNLGFVCEVAREHQDRLPVGSLESRRRSGQTVRIASAERQQRALPGQCMRCRQAYTLAAGGDQCHLALETEIHAVTVPRP